MVASLSGEGSVGGSISFNFVHNLLLDALRESRGVGSLVGDIIRCHFGVNVVRFALESSEHGKHEHYVLSGNGLGIYVSAEIAHSISHYLPGGNIFGVGDRENLLNEAYLGDGSLLLVASDKVCPCCMGVVRHQGR